MKICRLLIFLFFITISPAYVFACPGGEKICDENGNCVQAKCVQKPSFMVEDAYSYPTSPSQKNGAAFMVLQNSGDKDLRVVGASSDIAETVELHTHLMDGDMMMMREVDFYDVKAHEETALEPSGHHIMLMGLTRQLVEGESFDLKLEMEDGQSYDVTVTVGVP
ncbi:copper chaperone PCu(A)C [Alphaproteobacteria bacterium]|nr:copper chaperone PCu(A)C [Alphaproteobacteria bacterium]